MPVAASHALWFSITTTSSLDGRAVAGVAVLVAAGSFPADGEVDGCAAPHLGPVAVAPVEVGPVAPPLDVTPWPFEQAEATPNASVSSTTPRGVDSPGTSLRTVVKRWRA